MPPIQPSPAGAVPAPARDSWIRRSLAAGLIVLAVCLFVPWTATADPPTIDARPELVWASVAMIGLGALGLALRSRWTAYLAALPAIFALTDLGPVLWASGSGYPTVVVVVVLVGATVGVGWIALGVLRARRSPSTTQWVIAPIGLLLGLASLGLPWYVLSEIGSESGPTTAWELILGSPVGLPSGVSPTRIIIMLTLFIGVGAAVVPLALRHFRAADTAVVCTLAASVALLLTDGWTSARADAIEPATGSPGQRVCLVGLVLLSIVWSSPRLVEPEIVVAASDRSPDPAPNLVL